MSAMQLEEWIGKRKMGLLPSRVSKLIIVPEGFC